MTSEAWLALLGAFGCGYTTAQLLAAYQRNGNPDVRVFRWYVLLGNFCLVVQWVLP